MTTNPRPRHASNDYPQLREFAAGYLHQDFALEHGTPRKARAAFLAEASDGERQRFLDESARFLTASADSPWADVRAAWADLGAAWRPSSRAVLHALLEGDEPPAPQAGQTTRRRS